MQRPTSNEHRGIVRVHIWCGSIWPVDKHLDWIALQSSFFQACSESFPDIDEKYNLVPEWSSRTFRQADLRRCFSLGCLLLKHIKTARIRTRNSERMGFKWQARDRWHGKIGSLPGRPVEMRWTGEPQPHEISGQKFGGCICRGLWPIFKVEHYHSEGTDNTV